MPTITRMTNNMQVSLGKINNYPTVGLNVALPLATVHIVTPVNSLKGVIVQGSVGQLQDPLEVQDSSANILLGVSPSGNILIRGVITSGSNSVPLTDTTGKVLASSLNTIDVAHGGTGISTLTPNGILVAGSAPTSPISQLTGTITGQIPVWNNSTQQFTMASQSGGGNVSSNTTGATSTTGNIIKWLGANLATDSIITEYISGGATLIGINKSVPTGKLHVKSLSVTTPTLVIERAASQTADLLKIVAEDGTTPILSISASGMTGMGTGATNTNLLTIAGTLSTTGSDLSGLNGNSFVLSPSNTYNAYFMRVGGSVATTTGMTNPNVYGQYIGTIGKTGSGTITNSYGIYVAAPTSGTNNYSALFESQVQIGTTPTSGNVLELSANLPLVSGGGARGIRIAPTLNPDNGQNAVGISVDPTINVVSPNSATYFGIRITTGTLTGNGAISSATGLVIEPQTIGANNYAADFRGSVGIGGGTSVVSNNALLALGGNVSSVGSDSFGIYENITLTPPSSQNAVLNYFGGTIAIGTSTSISTAYGVYIPSITKSGNGSIQVSYGLFVGASNIAIHNYSAYFAASVGINQNAPASMLHIVGNNNALPVVIEQASANQSANIHEWWSSTAVQSAITSNGTFSITPTTIPTFPNILSKAAPSVVFSSPNLITTQSNGGASYFTVGALGNIGIGNNPTQYRAIDITTNVPLVSASDSTGINNTTTINPDTGYTGYGLSNNPTVNAGTGLTPSAAYGFSNVLSKTGSGTIGIARGAYFATPNFGTSSNNAVYIDGSIGNGAGTINLAIRKGSSQTGDFLQILDNASTVLSNINQYGNLGIGVNNNFKRVKLSLGGTIDGLAEANNTHDLILSANHITNPGSSSYGMYVQDNIQVASGTNSNYYGIYVLGASKSGGGTYATSYGLALYASSFATVNYAAVFMAGNVGIGTTAPAYTLDVSGPIQSSYSINKGTLNRGYNFTTSLTNPATITVLDVSSAGGAGGALQIGANNQVWAAIHGYYYDGTGNGRGNIVLSTRRGAADATLTPAIVVGGTNGYVGINTTGAAYPLDVNGAANINGTLTVVGSLSANSNASVSGTLTVSGNLSANSNIFVNSSNKLFFWDTSGNHSIGSISSGYMQIRDYYGISLISSAYNSTINFTGAWQSTVSTTTSEISNDQGTYQALMIAGNTSSGTRKINLYDNVLVNGTLGVSSTFTAGSTVNIGNNAVLINSQTKYGFQNDPSNYFIQYHDAQQQMYFNSYYGRFAFRNGPGGIGQIRIDTTSTANSLYITTNNYQGYGGNNTAEISNDTGGTYNALMIVGNSNSNPNSRKTTKLYDDLVVSGNISKASGSFLIDHPLDLENKNLYHSFIEGPRADLIYRGEVTLVAGKAEVNLDTDAVDPSAQKMTVGTFSALTQNAKVYGLNNANSFTRVRSTPIVDGKFTIIAENESCTDEISWLVVAERHDAYMTHKKTNTTDDNGHLILEVEKADHDPISWQKTVETTTRHNTSDDTSLPYLSVENTRLPSPGTKGYPMHPEAHGLDCSSLMKKVITITEFPETNQDS